MNKNEKDNNNQFSLISINNNNDYNELFKFANNLYENEGKPAMNALKFLILFLVADIRPYMYEKIEESKYKIEKIKYEFDQKIKKIPTKNRTNPRLSIAGPVIDILKYNLDEEYIKEMFVNLLISEIDDRTQDKVLPSYAKIIEQLSADDANFLNIYYQLKEIIDEFYLLEFKNKKEKKYSFQFISNTFEDLEENQNNIYIKKDKISYFLYKANNKLNILNVKNTTIDNLIRLNILNINHNNIVLSDEIPNNLNDFCKKIIDKHRKNSLPTNGNMLDIEFTEFGSNFIDICCS